jgi:hypothetical protein
VISRTRWTLAAQVPEDPLKPSRIEPGNQPLVPEFFEIPSRSEVGEIGRYWP